jgi:Flp pilus assembly pilin Flp
VEYALMVGLIAVVIVASVTLFGQNTIGLFNVPSSAFNP